MIHATEPYYVTVTDQNGCSGIDSIFVEACAGIEVLNLENVNIFPNPVESKLFVQFSDEISEINYVMIDPSGRTVISGEASNAKKLIISVNSLDAGLYVLKLNDDKTFSVKILKK